MRFFIENFNLATFAQKQKRAKQ